MQPSETFLPVEGATCKLDDFTRTSFFHSNLKKRILKHYVVKLIGFTLGSHYKTVFSEICVAGYLCDWVYSQPLRSLRMCHLVRWHH